MSIKLLIADSDLNYGKRLGHILSRKFSNYFVITIISNAIQLAQEVNKNYIDILLIDEKLNIQIPKKNSLKLIISLVNEDQGLSEAVLHRKYFIHKYQRASTIATKILELYSEVDPVNSRFYATKNKAKIICVYSPIGGCGKSTLAVALAQKYVHLGKSTFYLNLESFPSTHLYFNNDGKGISAVLTQIYKGTNIEIMLNALIKKDEQTKVHYLNEPDNLLDIEVVSPDDIEKLISSVIISDKCNYLIIDTTTNLNEINLRVLKLSDEIIVVAENNTISELKLSKLISCEAISSTIKHKFRLILNKCNKSNNIYKTSIPIIGKVPIVATDNPMEVVNFIVRTCSIKLTE